MLRVALQIEYADGSAVDVAATAADLMAFETQYDKPFTVFADSLRLTYLMWLAWHVVKREGKTALEFDPWSQTVAGVRIGEADEVVPLESKAPTGS